MVDGFVARFEFADRLKHLRGVDVVHFESLADRVEERDGEFATEMFAKFFEAAEDDRLVFVVEVKQFAGEQLETEHFEKAEDAGFGGGIDVANAARIDHVQRDTDGDGFAVAQAVFGKLLELVRGPVAEIEGTGGTEFERIAGGGDVIEVEFGGTMDQALHRGGI